MNNFKLLNLMVATALLPSLGFAKTIHKYNLSVKVENENPLIGGRYGKAIDDYGDIGAAISHSLGGPGFTCNASLGVSQEETIQDAKGKDFQKTYSYKNDFTMTAFGQPQAAGDINVNFDNKNPHLSINVYQNCDGRIPGMCDNENNNGKHFCMKDISIPLSWNCAISGNDYPRPSLTDKQNLAAARDREFVCKPRNNMGYFNMLTDAQGAIVMEMLNKKKITTTLSWAGKSEHFERINCPSEEEIGNMDPALQKIFRISGGIKDGVITKSANYEISVNGMGPVYKTRDDGLSNFDVLYCKRDKDENVQLSVGVKTGNKEYEAQTFTAGKGNVLNSQRFNFKKDGWLWGSWESEINVQTIPAGVKTAK